MSTSKSKKDAKPFDYWLKKNKYYHHRLKKFFTFAVPQNAKVMVINCKNGYLLDALKPSRGVGIDSDQDALKTARSRYPEYQFYDAPLENIDLEETFDYIILVSVTMEANDIQDLFDSLKKFCNKKTRILIDTYSYIWEPALKIAQKIGMRRPTHLKNWISKYDMINFLYLSGYEPVTQGHRMLLPFYIPLISTFFNSVLAPIPLIRRLCLHQWIIARPMAKTIEKKELPQVATQYSVSVVVPCKNEKGNIEAAVTRCPNMGKYTEIIFVEGGSTDGTYEEIKRVAHKYTDKKITYYQQEGKGKGDAVRKGFAHASGDMLMILDADLTVPPEELTKFFDALATNKGDFINGSRLVYDKESNAMGFLAMIANFSFALLLGWITGQKIKDSLCGTKVLFREDYKKMEDYRKLFGKYDPFGDFDLLFGAAKLNLKIVDMPVHYKDRKYGTTQINRFKHVWFLLLTSLIAWRHFKIR